MKIGVFNRYWATMGGGERFGAGIAEVLLEDGEVELISTTALDLGAFADRFGVDLSRATVRHVEDDTRAVTAASADYDLFINVSYLSSDFSRAPRSIYVVHFPSPLGAVLTGWRRALAPLSALVHRHSQPVPNGWGEGFYPTEGSRRPITWTDGRAELFVLPEREVLDLRIRFGHARPVEAGTARVAVEVDGVEVLATHLEPRRDRLTRPMEVRVPLERRPDDEPCSVVVTSDTFSPAELFGVADTRRLGVPILAIYAGGGWGASLRARIPQLHRNRQRSYVDSYTVVAANADFTRRFVRRWWGVEAEVLYPPVAMQPQGEKRNTILSVGRFFRAEQGHSKKQLEMVHAFRRLHDQGATDWELHLVGGCSPEDEPYLDEVIAAAHGLPVHIHRDASGEEVRTLYASASIFWSITGLGEDPKQHPARFEHFGITTVEAMSAGAVPVVLAQGGQVEIVRHDIDGLHVHDLDSLVDATAKVIADPAWREALSASAAQRAEDFDMPAFARRLRRIVAMTEPGPSEDVS